MRLSSPSFIFLILVAKGLSSCGGDSSNIPPTNPDFSDSALRLLIDNRKLVFEWDEVTDASYYRLFENSDGASGFEQIGFDIPSGGSPEVGFNIDTGIYTAELDISVHLQDWENARYLVESCRVDDVCVFLGEQGAPGLSATAIQYVKVSTASQASFGFSLALSEDGSTFASGAIGESTIEFDEEGNSAECFNDDDEQIACPSSPNSGTVFIFNLDAEELLIDSIIKAPNADDFDGFGADLDLSDDGNLLVVSAIGEDSNNIEARGNDDAESAGAAYVFSRGEDGVWPLPGEQADYLKASNAEAEDFFGSKVEISGNGAWIAVSAIAEASSSTGINNNQENNDSPNAGAVYLFRNFFGNWSQHSYIKASNTDPEDFFGTSIALNNAGDVLVVGASGESSSDVSDQSDNSKPSSGAVYVFTRDGLDWNQQAFIKAPNADPAQHSGDVNGDLFGASVSLNDDGSILLVGAPGEDSISRGIDGDSLDNNSRNSGAAYLYVRNGDNWDLEAYIKASNTGQIDEFGSSVMLSSSANSMVIGAQREASSSVGINGTENIDNTLGSGAAYYFENTISGIQQVAFIKASVRNLGMQFSWDTELAEDGTILAVSTPFEDAISTDSGAVFIY
ncbi:MAG: FG-GAP repeat protein [Pseudomonadota bacterium]|nr:FG-GAP repeat protein [Pseudomonadota bacterium]